MKLIYKTSNYLSDHDAYVQVKVYRHNGQYQIRLYVGGRRESVKTITIQDGGRQEALKCAENTIQWARVWK